ncbi:Phytochrome-associated serine/threonine-protein phosphatase [Hibiscus syriacus]|uniref:protein-serine/threonine phosphatase n=1 Tax=Hibiscus syriacus TaxID=106335 RepID=A0A6A2Y7N3_HIBSY|nr:Phytochrome-associated serine/threonine-protein phosphatase [Hibiscus syriacus]
MPTSTSFNVVASSISALLTALLERINGVIVALHPVLVTDYDPYGKNLVGQVQWSQLELMEREVKIRVIDRNCEIPHEGPFCDLMWSDPSDIETWAVSPRGAGWLFGSRVTSEFNHINKLDLVCRAHQLMQEGLKYMFQDKGLVTEREVKFFTETEENNQMRGPRTGVPYL